MNNLPNPKDPPPEKLRLTESQTLAKIDDIVKRNYLHNLSRLKILPLPSNLRKRTAGNCACLFPIKRIIYDREENNLQKMMNVYVGAAAIDASVVTIIHHPHSGKDVEIYFGVFDDNGRLSAHSKATMFYNNFIGNFPGCQTGKEKAPLKDPFLSTHDIDVLMSKCLDSKYHAISCVSGVASVREGTPSDNAAFFRGIEKLIDGMENIEYSAVILAGAIEHEKIADIQAEYESLYRMISPHAKRSLSLSRSAAETLSKNLSKSTSETLSHTKSSTMSVGETRTESHTEGGHKGTGDAYGGHVDTSGTFKVSADLDIPLLGKVGGEYEGTVGIGGSYTYSEFRGESWSDTTANAHNKVKSSGETDTEGTTTTVTTSDGKSISVTQGQSQQLTYENKTVQVLLSIIDQKIQRLHQGMEHGMFATAAYFVSAHERNVKSAAGIYKSLIIGDNSQIESAAVNSWEGDDTFDALKSYLQIFCHPRFALYDEEIVTPASIVTAGELAIHMGLPKKSVPGIPVSSSVSFGRSIHHVSDIHFASEDKNIPLGSIFHLGKAGGININLDAQSMTMHTLLCGTTGVGKSTSVCKILSNLPKNVNFLVIEPAKGEYKDELAGKATVYGTNPYLSKLLRLNPFRFCRGVHILEHLDRLSSIFNVCWSMEAAMPAILKQAMERAYIAAGWNLKYSKNSCANNLFPTTEDVMHEIENILNSSAYSAENKGNYVGALSARLRDLSVGINGMIFGSNDLSDAALFDANVIVDLSRVSNAETKALIMGLLVIRLQEYRQSQKKRNSSLRHITVLEEAHHLLRQTSTIDGANLVGRSVEMLANALAEMRSRGEGFLIVDQSPEQLDKSVIRNTNTKIIMRLPEGDDRQLVGKSVGLSDEQISELSKLPTGVAAVYQNDWLESVLVKISPESSPESESDCAPDEKFFEQTEENALTEAMLSFQSGLFKQRLAKFSKDSLAALQFPTALKRALIEYCNKHDARTLYCVAYEFFHVEDAINNALEHGSAIKSVPEFQYLTVRGLKPFPKVLERPDEMFVMFVCEYHRRNGKLKKIIKAIKNFKEV